MVNDTTEHMNKFGLGEWNRIRLDRHRLFLEHFLVECKLGVLEGF